MLFNQLGLSAELLRAVDEQGYKEATPIQREAIPLILKGRDVLAGAQTGTGKTAGFTLPLLHRLQTRPSGPRRIRALILTPTRELAAQVSESVRTYGRHLPIRATQIYGGVSIRPQIEKLRQGVDIVVATPGRLLDHMQQKTIDLSQIEVLVLDEADRMLDMGFIRDIRKVLKALPVQRQNLLFSATFSEDIRRLAADLLNQPTEIQVSPRNTTVERIKQLVHPVDKRRKRELLSHRIGKENWSQVLVFTRTKHGANRLAGQLTGDGLNAAAIHGNKSQGARTKALADFKAGRVRVLVATDIAARGLDIDKLPHVVNFELPHVPEDYVHRIGRTARAGLDGHAVSLVCIDEQKLLHDIEKLLNMKIEKQILPGYEPDSRIKAEPIQIGRPRRAGGQNNSSRNKPRGGKPNPRRGQGRRSA
jgi:ATP-dependent RNA helicase RhlE